jgi:hypothetical protein
MRKSLAAITVGCTLLLEATSASAIPLYRSLTIPSPTPDQQGWRYLKTPYPTAPSATATTTGGTILNSGNSRNYAGYFIQSPFMLERNAGYTVSFSVQINSESHSRDDRAGFSIIVTSNRQTTETQPFALELGFWTNSIWAYNANATRGESVSFNTQSAVTDYMLSIKGDRYWLFTKGSVTPILQGSLRQYTSYTPPPGFPNPYTTPNLIFMGDDTTSATAQVTIRRVYASPVSLI